MNERQFLELPRSVSRFGFRQQRIMIGQVKANCPSIFLTPPAHHPPFPYILVFTSSKSYTTSPIFILFIHYRGEFIKPFSPRGKNKGEMDGEITDPYHEGLTTSDSRKILENKKKLPFHAKEYLRHRVKQARRDPESMVFNPSGFRFSCIWRVWLNWGLKLGYPKEQTTWFTLLPK